MKLVPLSDKYLHDHFINDRIYAYALLRAEYKDGFLLLPKEAFTAREIRKCMPKDSNRPKVDCRTIAKAMKSFAAADYLIKDGYIDGYYVLEQEFLEDFMEVDDSILEYIVQRGTANSLKLYVVFKQKYDKAVEEKHFSKSKFFTIIELCDIMGYRVTGPLRNRLKKWLSYMTADQILGIREIAFDPARREMIGAHEHRFMITYVCDTWEK